MDEFSWAVGLIEGEGHFSVKNRVIIVAMNDRDVLERLQSALGGKVYGPYKHPNPAAALQWRWQLGGWSEVEPLVKRMLPHLGDRRRAQAEALLANPAGPPGVPRRGQDDPCPNGHTGEFGRTKRGRYCRACQREAKRRKVSAYHEIQEIGIPWASLGSMPRPARRASCGFQPAAWAWACRSVAAPRRASPRAAWCSRRG